MKFIATTLSLLFIAQASALYSYNVIKQNEDTVVAFECTINKTTARSEEISVSKYDSFMSGSAYNPYPFDCTRTPCGSNCFGKIPNESGCVLGNEGDFCSHYGGIPTLSKCFAL